MSVSNPKSKSVAYVSALSRISNCQGLGRKNKHEILKTDRRGQREQKGSFREYPKAKCVLVEYRGSFRLTNLTHIFSHINNNSHILSAESRCQTSIASRGLCEGAQRFGDGVGVLRHSVVYVIIMGAPIIMIIIRLIIIKSITILIYVLRHSIAYIILCHSMLCYSILVYIIL